MLSECGKGKPSLHFQDIFADAAFVKTGLVSAIFGAYFGTLIDSAYLGGTRRDVNDTPLWKSILQIVVGLLLLSPFISCYFLIKTSDYLAYLYIFKTTLPFFFLMVVLFSYLKVLFSFLYLVNHN